MPEESPATGPTRRDLWLTAVAGLATATMLSPSRASDEAVELIERLTGTTPTESDRLRVVAPRNPLIEVASFHFFPQRSHPRVSTRIRLAESQYVLAVAEMNDGALLMTKTWVEVATNGCA
jgi:sulfur-oxidizing protein SoxY